MTCFAVIVIGWHVISIAGHLWNVTKQLRDCQPNNAYFYPYVSVYICRWQGVEGTVCQRPCYLKHFALLLGLVLANCSFCLMQGKCMPSNIIIVSLPITLQIDL